MTRWIPAARRGTAEFASLALRLYLAAFVAGCAGTKKPVTVSEAREMETATAEADFDTTLKASVNALQDMGFTIDTLNDKLGLVTASRRTVGEQAELTREPKAKESGGGTPTWLKVLGFVFVIGAVVWVISELSDGGDQDGKKKADDTPDHTEVVHVHEGDDGPSGPNVYQYRVTVNLNAVTRAETQVRVSAQGERMVGGDVVEAGPIRDADFFERFFKGLDISVRMEE